MNDLYRKKPLADSNTTSAIRMQVGDRVRCDGKRTAWSVRASACSGRYFIATCSIFGVVYYTIIDLLGEVRGPLNIIGHGLDIFTTSGPDEGIDLAVRLLESDEGWTISHRACVPLVVTS